MTTLTREGVRTEAAAPPMAPARASGGWRILTSTSCPRVLVMLVMTYYPMGYGVWMSFTDYGLKNLRLNSRLRTLLVCRTILTSSPTTSRRSSISTFFIPFRSIYSGRYPM